ncbi:uncharacterized protein LOC118436547 [Folsomia candida]|nr:uncharacterized protein LOC118436547 [Folsomia candida]
MKRKMLGALLKSDIKKIRVVEHKNDIIIKKTTQPLLPFDGVYGEGSLKTTKDDSNPKTVPDLLLEVNHNAARGHTEPGTFRCREGHCLVTGPNISGTNSLQWGPQPHHNLPLRKRFTCESNNVVYMIHCAACIINGNWSTYIGNSNLATHNIHFRFRQHRQQVCDQTLRERYPPPELEETVTRRLNGEEDDEDDLLQDPFVHFRYVHNQNDMRFTILDGNFPTDRCRNRCESYYKLVCGNYEYDPHTLSGSLNRKN